MEDSAEAEIRARIARQGKIPFAEFMELALYHGVDGYYARRSDVGARRDYYTSPSAHPAFGALLALQLREMWEVLGRPERFHAVEIGAGSGRLASDVTGYTALLPGDFGRALRYVALDRSPPNAEGEGLLTPHERVIADGVPFANLVGCLLSNELIDAFPVHRFEIKGRKAREVYVAVENGELVDRLGEPSTPELACRLQRPALELPDGHRGEVGLGTGSWLAGVSRALARGFVLTIDYGYEATRPDRGGKPTGTVQTYFRHTSGADPYRRIGIQDITAHVDFSRLASDGAAAGLASLGTVTQGQYLHGLGLGRWLQQLRGENLGPQERDANMMAMRDLARPDGLGGFKVLVQEKGTGVTDLVRLLPQPGAVDDLPLPLLGPDHLQLMAARYPHAMWQPDEPWSGLPLHDRG